MNFKYYNTHNLILFIIGMSVVFGFTYTFLIHPVIEHSPEPLKSLIIYTEMFSIPFLISGIFLFINKIGWKKKYLHWLVQVPNLNGRYKGELVSSYKDPDGNPVLKDLVIEIKQNASSIKVSSYSSDKGKDIQTSSSFSISEELVKDQYGFYILYFIYSNEVNTLQSQLFNQQTQIHNHFGFQRFKYFPDTKFLEGEYFNQRQNLGTIKVWYEQEQLLGRFKK